MSNGVGRLLDFPPKAREVDLLAEFYKRWKYLHAIRKNGADTDMLQSAAQDLLESSIAIDYYRNRFKDKNGR